MRMVTAIQNRKNGGEMDLTWAYPVNLIWWYVFPFHSSTPIHLWLEKSHTRLLDSLVEMYIGIVCACLPCLKAFARRFFPNSFLFSPVFEQRVNSSLRFPVSIRLNSTIARPDPAGAGANGDVAPDSKAVGNMPAVPEKVADKGGRGQYAAALAAAAAAAGTSNPSAAAEESGKSAGKKGWWRLSGAKAEGEGQKINKSQSQEKMTENPGMGYASGAGTDVDLERGESAASLEAVSVGTSGARMN
jgi:hypothetical protein